MQFINQTNILNSIVKYKTICYNISTTTVIGESMIKLENVSKVYGEGEEAVVALRNVSLVIPDGKFVAIVGKSGSGKSTLLNLIGALDVPSEGTIFNNELCINELNDNELSDYRNKNIGFIFQAFYLEPKLTVLENVELPLVIGRVDKKVRRELAEKIIKQFGLEDKLNKKVNTLSGGQKQRVSIVRALMNSPALILADEPTGNLDKMNGKEVMTTLRRISDEGRTVILVTHNMDDAEKADYIIEIEDGEIVNTTINNTVAYEES